MELKLEISLLQLLGTLTALASFISTWAMWKIGRNQAVLDKYEVKIQSVSANAEKQLKEECGDLSDKINKVNTNLESKITHLDISSMQVKEAIAKDFQEIRNIISEHKREAISEIKTRQLIDDKVEPVWDVLRDLKGSIQNITTSQNDILKALSRMEGSLEGKSGSTHNRRRGD